MKKQKGFTLIELLAVIVILAIIALIATPIVLNMINSAKKKAAESGALGFIEAIEYNNGFAQTEQAGYTEINGENLDVTSSVFDNLKMKGKRPTSGTVTIVNGKVTGATGLCVEGYIVTYDGKDASVGDKCGSSSSNTTPSTLAVGTAVYLNPKNLSTSCSISNSQIGLGEANESGCMKFYVFDNSGDNYKLILDHNTTAKIAWVTQADYNDDTNWTVDGYPAGNNNKGPLTANAQLAIDTNGWTGNPRLITADEVAHIVGADRNDTIKWSSNKTYYMGGDLPNPETESYTFYLDGSGKTYSENDGWLKQVATSQGASNYAWLFDYTGDEWDTGDGHVIHQCTEYGCNVGSTSTVGYWTSTATLGRPNRAWSVVYNGALTNSSIRTNDLGIRPVITLSKSQIN